MLLQLNQSLSFTGLTTATYTAPAAGTYKFQVYATLPPGSDLYIAINNNGAYDPNYTIGGTGNNLGPSLGGTAIAFMAAGDTVTVSITSDQAVDSGLNAVTGFINTFQTEQY
jgi:hypothetical protein